MFIVNSYTLAIIFCFITMICWGSWGNTQKLASKNWRYELYYWDYTIGILLFALLLVSHSEVSEIRERFSGRYPASRYQIHSQCLDRRNYFQCFQHLTFSFGLHSRNGGCFSVGRRTCLGPRCVHQLFQHS